MKFIFFILFLSMSGCGFIEKSPRQRSCSVLKDCLDIASSITKKNYLYGDFSLDDKINQSGEIHWTKDNADFLIGELLKEFGYYRMPTPNPNVYTLMHARDVRYTANVPSFKADIGSQDTLPSANSADPAELVYTSKNPGRPQEIARNLRPFLSRYGRVIDVRASNIVILRDSTAALHQLLPLMRKMDVPVTKAELQQAEKEYKIEMMRERTRAEIASKVQELLDKKKNEKKAPEGASPVKP